jgi:hypothetical protein
VNSNPKDKQLVTKLWDIHLKVLKHLLNQKSFEWIQVELKEDFKKTNYVENIKKSGNLSFDENNKLLGAYPIAPFKSDYKVIVENEGEGYSMCAIDALGVAYTFNSKTTIQAIDKSTDRTINIIVDPKVENQTGPQLFTTYKDTPEALHGKKSAAIVQCPEINFYSKRDDIPQHLQIMNFDEALNYAKKRFSPRELKLRILNSSGLK